MGFYTSRANDECNSAHKCSIFPCLWLRKYFCTLVQYLAILTTNPCNNILAIAVSELFSHIGQVLLPILVVQWNLRGLHTPLFMCVDNVHGDGHGYLAMPSPVRTYCLACRGFCSSPTTVGPRLWLTQLMKSVSGVVRENGLKQPTLRLDPTHSLVAWPWHSSLPH